MELSTVLALNFRVLAAALAFALPMTTCAAGAADAADSTAAPAAAIPAAGDAVQTAQESADAFNDVPPTHWAYQAVQELAADGYIKGYPDGTFHGNRPLTRYELVSFIDRALSSIVAAQINGQDVNARDLANIKKLMAQYSGDLKDLQSQVAAIKSQLVDDAAKRKQDESDIAAVTQVATAAKTEADAAVTAVARVRGGLQFSYKTAAAYLDYEATNGPYARAVGAAGTYSPAVAANAPFPAYYGAYPSITRGITFANGPGGTNSPYTGPFSQGASEWGVRTLFAGNLDTHFSYNVRLSFVDQMDTPLGLTSDNKAYCTSAPPSAGGLPGTSLGSYPCAYQDNSGFASSIAFNINRFQVEWASQPGGTGVGALAGKISAPLNTGSRNINPLIGYQNKMGGAIFYVDPSPNDWIEAAADYGADPTGVSSEELAQVNAISPVCTNVLGLNTGSTLSATPGRMNPYCNGASDEFYGLVQLYDKGTGTAGGFNDDNFNAYPFQYWNPAAGLCATSPANAASGAASAVALNRGACQGATPYSLANATGAYMTEQGPINLASVWFSQVLGNKAAHKMIFQYDYGFRTGDDPFTGKGWTGNGTQQFTFVYASKGNTAWGRGVPTYGTNGGAGAANSNVIFATALFTGLNSISPIQGPNGNFEGVGYNTGIGNYSGIQFEALQYLHWFTPNVNLNLALVHQGTLPGVNIPAGSTSCPGCYIDHVNSNLIDLETWWAF